MLPALFLAAFVAFAAYAAPANARTVEDCEKIRDWHAYNTCLASFGPRRGQRGFRGSAAEDPENRGVRSLRQRGAPRAVVPGLSNVQRVKGGRVRATFEVGGPRRR